MRNLKFWLDDVTKAWDTFWFSVRDGKTLGLIRLSMGLVVFYSHLAWSPLLIRFLSPDGMLPASYRELLFDSSLAWSHFDWIGSEPSVLWLFHVVALTIMLLFALGFWTRATGIVTALLVISYANRATGALFGLDQIAAFVTLYLALSDCGESFSLAKRLGISKTVAKPSVRNNVAIRLIQIHLCVVYLFAGLGKCQGETWWNGEAIWGAVASYEYQTMDMTWLADHMWLVSIVTMVTLFFEVGYAALIWSKLTRPVMLGLAIPLHLGIGLCMGMMEFGMAMLVANLAFVELSGLNSKNEPER
jgi:hypothetical protein